MLALSDQLRATKESLSGLEAELKTTKETVAALAEAERLTNDRLHALREEADRQFQAIKAEAAMQHVHDVKALEAAAALHRRVTEAADTKASELQEKASRLVRIRVRMQGRYALCSLQEGVASSLVGSQDTNFWPGH